MEIPLSLLVMTKNSRSGDIVAFATCVLVGAGTGRGVLVGIGRGVLVGTGKGVLVGTGRGVLVGTGRGVLVGTGRGVLVEFSVVCGGVVDISCVHAVSTQRDIMMININLSIVK